MHNGPSAFAVMVHARGLHESLTQRCAVPGTLIIHVLAPEALWAVVAAGTMFQWLHSKAAVLTGERFLAGDEDHEARIYDF